MTQYTPNRNYPYPDQGTKPYYTNIEDTLDAIDLDMENVDTTTVLTIYNTIGTVSAPGELRGNEGAADTVAFAKGFWDPDDSGGGYFFWIVDATPPPDDGGTVIIPIGSTTGYWRRHFKGNVLNAKWFGARSVNPDNGAYLNNILSGLGSNTGTIVLPQDPGVINTDYICTTSVTFPTNVILAVEDGARIDRDTMTLTINSRIEAGSNQIFLGAGSTVFGNGGEGRAIWWPAPNNINAAVNSGLSVVLLDDGLYEPTVTIDIPDRVTMHGSLVPHESGYTGVIIKPTSAVSTAILMDGVKDLDLRNFKIDMDNMLHATSYVASTISFSNTFGTDRYCTISDSANGLGFWDEGMTVGVAGSTANNRTYPVESATAGALTCKGTMTSEGAGPSITLRAGPYGMRLKGVQRGLFENIRIDGNESEDGTVAWFLSNQTSAGFATYYNTFINCNARNINTGTKRGIGTLAQGIPVSTVTNNTFITSPMQAWGVNWFFTHTGSGFALLNCNSEQPGEWGLFANDVIASKDRAIKVFGGEHDSAFAGEYGALVVTQGTIHNAIDDNVLFERFDRTLNVPNQYVPDWSLSDQGATSGETYTFSIKDLVDKIGSDQATIYLINDSQTQPTLYTFDTDETISDNITVKIQRGAQIYINSTKTVTISGRIEAGPYQIFDGPGTIITGGGEGWTNWWDEINTAVNSGLKRLHTESGFYEPTEAIDVPISVNWTGTQSRDGGSTGVVLRPTSAVHKGILIDGTQYITIKNIQINMDNMTPEIIFGPATTVSFTSAADGGTISDSGSGFGSFTEGMTLGVSGSTGGLNDGTYAIIAATASTLTVKGVSLTTQSAGPSIALEAGPIGIHVKGCKRGLFENVRAWVNAADHGTVGWFVTPRDSSAFASYYNTWINCSAKSETQKRGIGICVTAMGSGAVTNNTFLTCPVQAWDICWQTSSTGAGFMIINSNGESADTYGIYTTDVPSGRNTAVKILGGEWHSADAGETEALLMWNNVINGTVGDNVLQQYYGDTFNGRLRADYFVGEEALSDYGAGATISPTSTFMRIKGTSAPVTLNTTTPIAAGDRGQILCLIGNDATNIVTIENSGNIKLTQGIWYGITDNALWLYYSTTGNKWIEITRTDANPLVIRTPKNAFFSFKYDEIELTLSGATTTWSNAIPTGVDVLVVTSRVTELITGAGVTGYQVGTAADPNHWASINSVTVGTTTDMANMTDRTRAIFITTTNIVITAIGGSFTSGKLRLSLGYWDSKAATS